MKYEGSVSDTIVDLGRGHLGYQSIARDYDNPIERIWVWPLVNIHIEGMMRRHETDAIGKDATCRDGHVSAYLGDGVYFRARMPELGRTKALSITERPVPRPERVRTQLRWHHYRWEKLLRGGWVSAEKLPEKDI